MGIYPSNPIFQKIPAGARKATDALALQVERGGIRTLHMATLVSRLDNPIETIMDNGNIDNGKNMCKMGDL